MDRLHRAEKTRRQIKSVKVTQRHQRIFIVAAILLFAASCSAPIKKASAGEKRITLPSSKLLMRPVPGDPRALNSFPTSAALSPDGKYLAILNNGYGTEESGYQQSIAVMNLATNKVTDFPDARLGQHARQTYFLGLAFSPDGSELYASMASMSDPEGRRPRDTGNGIAVYSFTDGSLAPKNFLKIPLAPRAAGKVLPESLRRHLPAGKTVGFPAGLAVVRGKAGTELLIAENLADDAILLNAATDKVVARFPFSTGRLVPSLFPYGVVAEKGGHKAFCSLWNGSEVAELDLATGRVVRRISLERPASKVAPGSHPTAMLLSPDGKRLYVALTNSDGVAVINTVNGEVEAMLSTLLPGEKFGGTDPEALAQSADGKRLFVADAMSDAVAVFDMTSLPSSSISKPAEAAGFIPTEWYPTALAVQGDDLFIVTGKGEGTGPNANFVPGRRPHSRKKHPYIAELIHGSVARVGIAAVESNLANLTRQVLESNLMTPNPDDTIHFAAGSNPIRHVIYIIKENRTYDQIFGDIKAGNGDPSLCLYCRDITPNEHELALQFGVIDNFYCSGEVSGDGHVWSTAATSSDYNEKTWEISYRGRERTYDYEGEVLDSVPLSEGVPDVDDPGTGYIWGDVARHHLTHRNYGEFVATHWCGETRRNQSPKNGTPLPEGGNCRPAFVRHGQPLPANVGDPRGGPSPWPWPIPMIAWDQPTMPQLAGHFDPRAADFRLDYPDQFRVDEFMNEFQQFVKARETHHGADHVDAHRSTALVVSKYSPGSSAHPFVDNHFYTTVAMIRTIERLLGLPPMNNNDAQAPVMSAMFSGKGDQPAFTADYQNRDNGLIYRMNPPHGPGARASAKMDFTHADAANAHLLNAILWRNRKGNIPMPKPVHRVFPY